MESNNKINQVSFESEDGVMIMADQYDIANPKGFVILCHMANSSRGEYRKIAPKLNELGFTCLAVDLRSGSNSDGVRNETKVNASGKGLPTSYIDARPDMEAAVNYLFKKYGQSVILLGSSYSASLTPLISLNNDKIKAGAVFSPGEYLPGINLANEIKPLDKPIFVTSAKGEFSASSQIVQNVDPNFVTLYNPSVSGAHGSRSLLESTKGYELYWDNLNKFLLEIA